jgi:hypothetical protein
MKATSALWLLCSGMANGGAFAFALNFLLLFLPREKVNII